MIYLKDGLNFHNLYLDYQPRTFFKRRKGESVGDWLSRTAYQGENGFFGKLEWRERNEFWLKDSFKISFSVLSFLRENNVEKETFEDLVGFEVNLKGSHDWTLSEIRKLELIMNKKLL